MEATFLQGLNQPQRDAVLATEGRIRVIAGAGAGKTKTLAHRYAFLVNELGISPSHILCLTFTNKAASEMRQRIMKMVDEGNVNDYNSDNENMSLLINVYCPFKEWLISGDDLRPFAIMAEIRKTLQGARINGLGELKYLGFSLSTLTEEMGAYVMRFTINAFN